jgi:hypothetical protein
MFESIHWKMIQEIDGSAGACLKKATGATDN